MEEDPLLKLLEGGIVVDEHIAARSPCTCVKVDDKEICWSPGIIGSLSPAQRGAVDKPGPYCLSKAYKESPRLRERIRRFKEAVEQCKDMKLEERLKCLSNAFRERGIEV